MPRSYGHLTGEQAEHFLERGFVTVRSAFEPADAQQWLDNAWIRFGFDRHDPASWDPELIAQCHDFVEMTGEAGDVVLPHPYTLHATSQNVLGVGRSSRTRRWHCASR